MQRRGRLFVPIALAALALVIAPAADAKFALVFHEATATPGEAVTATGVTVWPGVTRYLSGVVVYLVPTRLGHADYNTGWAVLPPPGSRHTYRLGKMSERRQRLFLRFKVPRVPPGNYMTAFWCLPHTFCGDVGTFYAAGLWGAPFTGKPGFVIRIRN
jgi:hypothetical protein